jgi:hypothetical protein
MPPYEPKIDSREFAITNPDQSSGALSSDASGDATDIAIRIWGADRAAGLTWKSDSVLVCMMADLVGASRGQIAEESPAVMAAHFDNSRLAVVAAKRIQMAMLEFVACRPAQPTGSAIVIYRPRTTESTGLSGEMVQMELGQAKPGQILLAENIAQRLRDLPGIEFEAASVLGASAEGPNGLPELVWTTPERLARLRESVGAVRSAEGPPAGATMIVDSPYALRGAPHRRALNEVVLNEAVPAVEGADHFAVRDRGEGGTISGNFRESSGSSLAGMDFEEKPFFTRTRILLGVVAVVLVGAVIAIFFRPTTVSKRPTPPLQQEQSGAEQKSSGAPAGAPGVESEGQKPAPESTTVQAPAPAVVAPANPVKASDGRARKKKEPAAVVAPTEPAQEVPSEFGGMSVKDIPRLLELAKKDAGAGLYDKARGEYQTILRLKPGDSEALEGLRRIRIALENKDQ